MMLLSASQRQVEVNLNAVGFQFLAFGVGKKKVQIDLSKAHRIGSKYVIVPSSLDNQIEKQLSNGIELVRTNADTLVVEFYGVISKKIPIKPDYKIQFAKNHLLNGTITVRPDSIIVKGPTSEIDTMRYVRTERVELLDLKSDFSVVSRLKKPAGLQKTLYSKSEVSLVGTVSRFSEKILRVPVTMVNLPENTIAQTFPNEVEVLIKAGLTDLKKVKPSDISVIGDYASSTDANNKTVLLRIIDLPKTIHAAELRTNHVDFILKRE